MSSAEQTQNMRSESHISSTALSMPALGSLSLDLDDAPACKASVQVVMQDCAAGVPRSDSACCADRLAVSSESFASNPLFADVTMLPELPDKAWCKIFACLLHPSHPGAIWSGRMTPHTSNMLHACGFGTAPSEAPAMLRSVPQTAESNAGTRTLITAQRVCKRWRALISGHVVTHCAVLQPTCKEVEADEAEGVSALQLSDGERGQRTVASAGPTLQDMQDAAARKPYKLRSMVLAARPHDFARTASLLSLAGEVLAHLQCLAMLPIRSNAVAENHASVALPSVLSLITITQK